MTPNTSAVDLLGDAFGTFQRSAFRLESRQVYDIDEEKEDFRAFRNGNVPDECPGGLEDWCRDIAVATGKGKIYQRARRIEFPLTDYTRFEILSGFRFSEPAGEQIRLLENKILPKEIAEAGDFWLFDDSKGFLQDYDDAGKFLGVREIPDSEIPKYVAIKKQALMLGIPLRESRAWQLTTAEK